MGSSKAWRQGLLVCTAFFSAALVANSAAAQSVGGHGGNGNYDSMGGAGQTYGVPGRSAIDTRYYPGGGGGGGAGAAGGKGGSNTGSGGAAGISGNAGNPTGGNGGDGGNHNYGGGGGGGGGGNGVQFTTGGMQIIVNATGGSGGNGGTTLSNNAGAGGGGGSGGYGVGVTGGASTLTVFGTVKGGNGGAGGNGIGDLNSGGSSGSGGSGGGGVYVGSAGSTLNLASGSIIGGNGGSAGYGGRGNGNSGRGGNGIDFIGAGNNVVTVANGTTIQGGNGASGAAGGAGIVGNGISIFNDGRITGGYANLGSPGAEKADAIIFTGGTNYLRLGNTGTIDGNIGISGALFIDPGTTAAGSVTLGSVIDGPGSLTKSGEGRLVLTGNNTYGATTFAAGILNAGSAGALGTSGTIRFTGGTLQYSAANQTDYSNRFSTAAGQAFNVDTNGQNVTWAADLRSSGASLTKSGTGTLTLGGNNELGGGVTIAEGGTLSLGSAGALGSSGQLTFDTRGWGTLQYSANNQTDYSSRISTTALQNIGIDTNGQNVTFATGITAIGSTLKKSGAGTLTLTGTNAAGLIISDGSVALKDNGSVDGYVHFTAGGLQPVLDISQIASGATILGLSSDGQDGTVKLGDKTLTINGNSLASFLGVIEGTGGVTLAGGSMALGGVNTYTGATTVQAGALMLQDDNAIAASSELNITGAATVYLDTATATLRTLRGVAGSEVAVQDKLKITNGSTTYAGVIRDYGGAGGLIIAGGHQTLTGNNSYTGGTTFAGGTLTVASASALGTSGTLSFAGGTLQHSAVNQTDYSSRFSTAAGQKYSVDTNGQDITWATGLTSSGGSLTKSGAGMLTLTGNNSYNGGTIIAAGTLQAGSAGALGTSGAVSFAGGMLQYSAANQTDYSSRFSTAAGQKYNVDTNGQDVTLATGLTSSGGSLTKSGTGTLTLTGISTYTGTTTIEGGGALTVNGSIASSSQTVVKAGGRLGGNGKVGNVTLDGGTLAPGGSAGTLTVQGDLAMTSASTYLVDVSPASAARVDVTGKATLAGATLQTSYAPGSYVTRQYTILTAAGGVNGIFNGPVSSNLPSSVTQTVSYGPDGTTAYLNTRLKFSVPGGLNGNQQSVANALTSHFNSTGGIPVTFAALSPTGLSQAAGETAAGFQQTTFGAMDQFLGFLGAGWTRDRGPDGDITASIGGVASIGASGPSRWTVWATPFGVSHKTNGNAAEGSSSLTSRLYGLAVGADYHLSPDTLAGFALAGGASTFSVGGYGTGKTDLFQAGAFIRHDFGAAYVDASLAYGWQDAKTERWVGAERLKAQLNPQSFAGRLEGGYRFDTPWIALTPYAAAQFATLALPSYSETAKAGVDTFALNYGSKTVTTTRTELGVRTNMSFPVDDKEVTLRSRLAWAHDFNADRTVTAAFQALPGASFVVTGATPATDALLASASAEVKFSNGWALSATVDGEFSKAMRSYAGRGAVRYAW